MTEATDFVKPGQWLMAKTVKDEPACIVIMSNRDGWVYYAYKGWKPGEHAFSQSRLQKQRYETVIRAIEEGAWEPKEMKEVDPEMRTAIAAFLSAVGERKTEEDYIDSLMHKSS